MGECEHDIGLFRAVTCSGPFKCKCPSCGEVLVRSHTRTATLLEILLSGVGIPAMVLFVMAIIWLPWVVAGTTLVFIALYAWDTIANPLHIETLEEKEREKKSNRQALIFVAIAAFSIAVYLANGT